MNKTVIVFGYGLRGRELYDWKNVMFTGDPELVYVDSDMKKWGLELHGGGESV